MNLIRKWLESFEAYLVGRLRAWYWHCEVEKMALEHFYHPETMPVEEKLKANLWALVAHTIHFFAEDEALLLEPPETEYKQP